MRSIIEVEKMKRDHSCIKKFKKGIARHVIPNSYIVMMKKNTKMTGMVSTCYYSYTHGDN